MKYIRSTFDAIYLSSNTPSNILTSFVIENEGWTWLAKYNLLKYNPSERILYDGDLYKYIDENKEKLTIAGTDTLLTLYPTLVRDLSGKRDEYYADQEMTDMYSLYPNLSSIEEYIDAYSSGRYVYGQKEPTENPIAIQSTPPSFGKLLEKSIIQVLEKWLTDVSDDKLAKLGLKRM